MSTSFSKILWLLLSAIHMPLVKTRSSEALEWHVHCMVSSPYVSVCLGFWCGVCVKLLFRTSFCHPRLWVQVLSLALVSLFSGGLSFFVTP